MLIYCWTTAKDVGPAINQHRSTSCGAFQLKFNLIWNYINYLNIIEKRINVLLYFTGFRRSLRQGEYNSKIPKPQYNVCFFKLNYVCSMIK